jgi:hypothetical protein
MEVKVGVHANQNVAAKAAPTEIFSSNKLHRHIVLPN